MAYALEKYLVPLIYRIWLRKIHGIENIPKKTNFILAINHSSYLDVMLVPSIVYPRINNHLTALVNGIYWKNPISRYVLNRWKCIPLYIRKEPGYKSKNKKSMNLAISELKKGVTIMIFPEGGRSTDGKLRKGYPGIAKIALKARVPVLPCGTIGTDKAFSKNSKFPRLGRIEVNIGKLMYFDKYYSRSSEQEVANKITRDIMKEIARLINQKYNY
jgi:1-acyl-sn-glycerol-3-phosphate acyltransferase